MTKTFATMTMAALATIVGVSETRAQSLQNRVEEASFELMQQAGSLTLEVRYGYRRHPHYDRIYEDVVDVYQRAAQVREAAGTTNWLPQVKADAAELAELFHHVREVIADVEATSPYTSSFHRGRALRTLGRMDDALGHLMDDLGMPYGEVTPTPVPVVVPPSRPVHRRVQKPVVHRSRPNVSLHRGGVTIRSRNGRFGITIGR